MEQFLLYILFSMITSFRIKFHLTFQILSDVQRSHINIVVKFFYYLRATIRQENIEIKNLSYKDILTLSCFIELI